MSCTACSTITTALLAAGWTGEEPDPTALLRHPGSGAVWGGINAARDRTLHLFGGCTLAFPCSTPAAVVIAACLAASKQLDPGQDRVELEERDQWLTWLEAAGLDNWSGVDVANDMRRESNS